MDILALYNSLPASTLAQTAVRMGVTSSMVRSRLLNADREAWENVRDVIASLDEKVEVISSQIETLLRDRIPA